jgi:hypothetical protein
MKVTSEIAAAWLPVLENASHEVFQTMLATQLEPGEREAIPGGWVHGDGRTGGQPVRCVERPLQPAIGGGSGTSLLGDASHEHAAAQAWDALGELANMIAGNFKNKLDGLSAACMLSVPTVITGGDYQTHSLTDSRPLELWFKFHGRAMEIALEIHS